MGRNMIATEPFKGQYVVYTVYPLYMVKLKTFYVDLWIFTITATDVHTNNM